MRFSLRHIELFVAVARCGTMSAAAEALAMSQSAASTALIELERRYDRRLFDRAGKRLRINETGRALLPAAIELLSRATEIDGLLSGRTGPGSLRLGATQTIGNYLAPRLIETFRQRHPGAELTLEIENTAEIAHMVADFSIDLGLIEGEQSHPNLIVTDWLDDALVLVCAPTHRLAGQERCTIDEVLAEHWVVRERGSGTRQALDRAMRPHMGGWRIGMELKQIEAILETVRVGSMIGCVSRLAVEGNVALGRVVKLDVPELDLGRRFYLVSHRDQYGTAGVRAFKRICAEFAGAGD